METLNLFQSNILEIPKHLKEVCFRNVLNSFAVLSFNTTNKLECVWFLSPFDLVVLIDSPYIHKVVNAEKQIFETQQRFTNWFKKNRKNACVLIGPDCDEAAANKFNGSYISTVEGPVSIKVDTIHNIAYVIKEGRIVRNYELLKTMCINP